ncbi:hypothetical protein [Ekhidna sp.]|uniref:hypothetical protein n=1 Tax=Ekhidna sp. TaxID=2608089 RepID=UPI003C7A78CC
MRKLLLLNLILSTFFGSYGQSSGKALPDTVSAIVSRINSLESWLRDQEAFRLNFENCNLEIHQTNLQSQGYSIYSFWLIDLDEQKIRLEYIDQFGTWVLKLETKNRLKTIQYSSSIPMGNVNKLHLYSDEKEPLIAIGKSLFLQLRIAKALSDSRLGDTPDILKNPTP